MILDNKVKAYSFNAIEIELPETSIGDAIIKESNVKLETNQFDEESEFYDEVRVIAKNLEPVKMGLEFFNNRNFDIVTKNWIILFLSFISLCLKFMKFFHFVILVLIIYLLFTGWKSITDESEINNNNNSGPEILNSYFKILKFLKAWANPRKTMILMNVLLAIFIESLVFPRKIVRLTEVILLIFALIQPFNLINKKGTLRNNWLIS